MATNGEQLNEGIVRKIQLLLNMAQRKTNNDGASNEAEAAAAMAKVQELLAKYNLDLAMVGGANLSGSGAKPIDENRGEQRMPRTAQYRWQTKLAKTICEANFCWHWVQEVYEDTRWNRHGIQKLSKPQRMKRHVILGTEVNRTVAEMMYNYLMDTIENILPYPNTERLSKAAQSWREGCVDRLCERIQEKAEQMKTVDPKVSTESQSTAIVLRSVHETEYAKNYDARYGEGAWARKLAREAKWKEEAAAEREAARAAALVPVEDKPAPIETEAQRRKREKEEEKERERNRKYWERQDRKWSREHERERNRLDHSAYSAGTRKGNDINLDSQLNRGKENKQI